MSPRDTSSTPTPTGVEFSPRTGEKERIIMDKLFEDIVVPGSELFDQWCDSDCPFFEFRDYHIECDFCDHYLGHEND